MEFWKAKKFKELNTEWNKKLKESGFEDLEVETKGERLLKQRAANSYRQANELERQTRLDYFLLLGYLAHNTKFDSSFDQLVMLRHSEGKTIKEIVDEISKNGISRDRKTIRYIIRRWQMRWGIRNWKLKQMNLKKTVIK